ncbi:MAG TPA: hypothetical protein VE981_16305 [Planctomycetota bacterium]|nr:hypothetical protein [Planctomycetota bacterium]
MKHVLVALILFSGAPLAFAEADPTLEEDAIVEVARSSRVERQKVRVLPPVPAPVLLRPVVVTLPPPAIPDPHHGSPRLFSRPPPAA